RARFVFTTVARFRSSLARNQRALARKRTWRISMRTMFLLAFVAGCGGSTDGSSSGGFTISVVDARWQYGIGASAAPSGSAVAVLKIAVDNTSATPAVLAAAPLFHVTTTNAIQVPVSGHVAQLDMPCTNLSVAAGGHLECSLAFEVPKGDVPAQLDYDDGGGR